MRSGDGSGRRHPSYVETPASAGLTPRDRLRVEATLRLADDLGATTVTLSGTTVADEVLAYAQTHNVTKVVVGKPARPRWKDLLFGSIVGDRALGRGCRRPSRAPRPTSCRRWRIRPSPSRP